MYMRNYTLENANAFYIFTGLFFIVRFRLPVKFCVLEECWNNTQIQ